MIDFRTTALLLITSMRSFFIFFFILTLHLNISCKYNHSPNRFSFSYCQILHVIAGRTHVLRPELGAIATE
ncbi:hypothetical protein M438DRAFT_341177 [Aureobasidium pullulans EXF-150]|uniref:Uncharacterized protein n=1 Tax=Aureobasidium pullulans EXF-150 TaxID=1043002 RepID=A0A074Y5C1_AURPU|nr:uncharacterized protein M438DRAFT_341177 [Aureobasidium pullulans EXF-150]KEQ89397.1 hypothetical protein M438DRAFT_341177 [Aureobasidium pullulans EXF-150]